MVGFPRLQAREEVNEQDDGPPRMQIGVDSHDVWRCKGCGKVLGVR